MPDLQNRLKNLTPEQRAILEKKLREKALAKADKEKISVREDLNAYPLSFNQERLWFLNQLNPDSAFYNMPSAIRIAGSLNVKVLEECLQTIIDRHQILKTKFIGTEKGPKQEIIDFTFKLEIQQISKHELQNKINYEANIPFDLSNGPLFRIKLLCISENEYVLLITFHHIVADGWSIGLIITELSHLYESRINNQNEDLPELKIQYFDYSEWSKNNFTKKVETEELDYWKQKLQGMPQVLELPIDKVRPIVSKNSGKRIKYDIPHRLHDSILNLAKQNNVSPFIIYLTILEVVLYRFTNQNDFAIGTPTNGRDNSEIKSLIGFFVNTVIIRAELNRDISFLELLKSVKNTVVESFEHQKLPFEKLVDEISSEKSITNSPLFQVMFDYQESPLSNLSLSDIKLEVLEQQVFSSKFDILFILENNFENQNIVIEYKTDIFKESTINSLGNIFINIIDAISKEPNEKIGLLEIIDEPLKNKLINEWNKTQTEYPRTTLTHKLFEKQVVKTPDNIAISFDEDKITYKLLNERANRIANYLIREGAQPNDRIAIYMERTIDLIAATVAILKCGCAYVPLDNSYPIDRIQFMLEDTQSKFVITHSTFADQTKKFTSPLVNIDQLDMSLEDCSILDPKVNINADDVAYIIYTSGSTGKPKGVAVPHKAINRLVLNTNYVTIIENSKIAQIANTSFDAATFEIWGALLNGAELVILSKENILNPDLFVKKLSDENISILFLTTALFNQIAAEYPSAFKSVETLLVGGEKLDQTSIKKVLDSEAPKYLYNVYGPTENTTFSLFYLIKEVGNNANGIPIGKSISNSTSYILDSNKNLVPVGVHGELYVGGDGVAKGYWNREELTSGVFINNPFSDKIDILYKTGDLVKYREDGNIEFIGRIDSQVKLRGFRIELGEIETAIKKTNLVKDVVVLVHGEKSIDRKLVAYVVPGEVDNSLNEKVSIKISSELPEYMIPKSFVILDKIPVTQNGKVDRKHLLKLKLEDEIKHDNFVAPRTKFEEYLSDIWQEILKIKNISVYDSFFELGGNSLQAAVFINRLKKELEIEIQVQSIFLAPTIDDFSKYASEYYGDLLNDKFDDNSSSNKLDINLSDATILSKNRINKFYNIIETNSNPPVNNENKNPSAIFILSPPRSGSTLLRVMLEGHNQLFSPPELDLLTYETLRDRSKILSGDLSFWLEATTRAVMELKNCSAEEAESLLLKFEEQNYSVKDFYYEMQNWAGGKVLVDKTPTYAMDPNILNKAESYFENPLYIHLTRNPYASIYSFIEAKLDKNFFRYDHDFNRLELAELIWMSSHKNILEFLNNVPEERHIRISFEDLVTDAKQEMERLAKFLNIEYDEKLVNPYSGNRMTDAVNQNSQMVGDFKFYLRNKIDNRVTERWRNFHKKNFLCSESLNISSTLGYDVENVAVQEHSRPNSLKFKKITENSKLELSFAQQRMWFLEQFEPGKPTYNIPAVVNLTGKLDPSLLTKSINSIIQRHETLRTYFVSEDGKAYQEIAPNFEITIEQYKLEGYSESEKKNLTNEIIQKEIKNPFDISSPPLLRFKLITLSESESILILNMHHIISDGWSLEIFVKELAYIYKNYSSNDRMPLQFPEYQYKDYSNWQREWMNTESYTSQLNYWKNKLSNIPSLIELPTDYLRPAERSQEGKKVKFVIDENLVSVLSDFAKKENVTLNVAFLAAFNILLQKYSNSEDIIIGTPVAGRTRSEIEPIIGFFVNTLVLRNIISKTDNIKKVLKSVNTTLIEAINHQEIPFEKLVDELEVERALDHSPIFQVMFVYNNSPLQEIELSNLKMQPQEVDLGTSKFDINFVITKRGTKHTAVLEYDTALFNDSTINRIIKSYLKILESLASNSVTHLQDIEYIDEHEQKVILEKFSGEKENYNIYKPLQKIFEDNLPSNENRVAIELNEEVITFEELNNRVNKMANYLFRRGVKSETLVAVCLERSIESIVSILAIWKAGGVYVPLDPNYPSDRLTYMIDDSDAHLIITVKEIANDLIIDREKLIELDVIREIESESSVAPSVDVDVSNLAYIIFTSGSTGKPKGVMVQHKSAINLMYELNDKIYNKFKDEKLRLSLNAPFPFDASMQEIVMLLLGHTLVIIPEEIRLDGALLLNYIQTKKIDLFDCVPTQLKILLDEGLMHDSNWKPKILLPGGEPIYRTMWNVLANSDEIISFNMYGPTECTVDSTICEINNSVNKPAIGKPIKNSIHLVLDDNLNVCPIGVIGELFIGGECLARGYFNKPEITAEKFIPNPYTNELGARIYRTGDLVRFLNDGNIEYVGRKDEQVKLRGFRIELGEIENVVSSFTSINDSVVLVKDDENQNKRLVGYYISNSEEEINSIELKKYISTQLPEYMVPSVFIKMDAFPLLPNKKINRKSFPTPEFTRESVEADFIEASNEIESILVDVWKDILKVDKIGTNDNFFELGGDSILGIQVVSKANQAGIKITPKNLFQYPTIKGLASIAEISKPIVAEQEYLLGKVELTPIQKWFFEQKFTNKHHWNQSLILQASGKVNVEYLKQACETLFKHHDVLRLKFIEDSMAEYIAHKSFAQFEIIELNIINDFEEQKLVENEINKLQSSLNIERGDVAKFALINTSTNNQYIVIILHHLIVDGVSWRIITEDLEITYRKLLNEEEIRLPNKTTSFKYWSQSLQNLAVSDDLFNELEFWKSQKIAEEFNSEVINKNYEENSSLFSDELDEKHTSDLLKELPKKFNVKINEILLTALCRANSQFYGKRKLSVAMEVHGREDLFEDIDISRTVGWFTSIFPLTLDLRDSVSILDSLKTIKEQLRNIPNNGIGYGLLKYLTQNENCGDLPHLPRISFNYLGQFKIDNNSNSAFRIADHFSTFERAEGNLRPFQLDIICSVVGEKLNISWIYNPNLYSNDEVKEFSHFYKKTLSEFIETEINNEDLYTASDFDSASINEDDLENIFEELE